MYAFIFNIIFFAIIASPSKLCNGLGSETDPIALTCRKVTDFGFCVYTLRSNPKSAGASVAGLAQVALDMVGSHAKDTSSYLQQLQKSSLASSKIAVNTCLQFFDHVTTTDVPSAVKFLNRKAYGNAGKAISDAMVDDEKCQKAVMKNPSANTQVLMGRNKYMHDLTQLTKDLIGLLR